MAKLATTFKTLSGIARAKSPLTDEEIRRAAPSIFADGAHRSRSTRYTHIPTSEVLAGLRKEGFMPFMVCQAGVRDETRADFTKHMMRLRHAGQIDGEEANEIILINSHDGSSSYQMLAGCYRFVCQNGLIVGNTVEDLRVQHKGDVVGRVVEGAYRILERFEEVDGSKDAMKALRLRPQEQEIFARSALVARYDGAAAPISAAQALRHRRPEDADGSVWSTFNTLQENLIRGGLIGRNSRDRRTSTRPVQGIDQSVHLNRALWMLAEEMKKLKEAA